MSVDAGTAATRWRWPLTPSGARVSTVIAVLDALGILISAPVAVAALVLQRPVPVPFWLVALAFPLILAGQICVILSLRVDLSQHRPPEGRWSMFRSRMIGAEMRNAMLGSLPRRARLALLIGYCVPLLIAATALPSSTRGGPGPSLPGCPYVLDNHGSYTCVSHSTYLYAGAALQRFAAGIVTAFLLVHAGTLWNVRTRVRQRPSDSLTPRSPPG